MRRLLLLLALIASPSLWAAETRLLTWEEMVPPDAPKVAPVMTPLHDLSKLSDTLAVESSPAAHQLAPDAPMVKALDGQQVRLPGYIVPLEVSEEGRVTEFLLVPYFGACIHVPPPPPNQIVHVTSELGVKVFTEPLDSPEGKKTRVRAGPFPNREAADKALDKMKRIGVNGVVAAKQ